MLKEYSDLVRTRLAAYVPLLKEVAAEAKAAPPQYVVALALVLIFFLGTVFPLVFHIFGDNAFGPVGAAICSFLGGALKLVGYASGMFLLVMAALGYAERTKG